VLPWTLSDPYFPVPVVVKGNTVCLSIGLSVGYLLITFLIVSANGPCWETIDQPQYYNRTSIISNSNELDIMEVLL
jgi:hypothetical protein